MSLRVVSTFSGISASSAAWMPLGFEMVGYCESAAFPAHVLHQRLGATAPKYLPDGPEFAVKRYAGINGGRIVNFGDVTRITDDDLRALGHVDLLEGGSPCQSFSVAGLRQGLADDRGNLALAFVDLALRMRRINGLRFVVWENVTGVLSHAHNPFGCFLAALAGDRNPLVAPGNKWPNSGHLLVRGDEEAPEDPGQATGGYVTIGWRVLDAQHFGVPQRRRRVFAVASFDPEVDAGQVLFERQSEERHPATGRRPQQAGPGTSPANSGAVTALIGMDSDTMIRIEPKAAFALKASNHKNVQVVIHPRTVGTLCASGAGTARPGGQASELDFVIVQGPMHSDEPGDFVCRRLTPLECERLQGFEDGWTDIAIDGKPVTDGHRYKALGNSIAVPCFAFIGERLRSAVAAAKRKRWREAA